MKRAVLAVIALTLLIAGCDYLVPLSADHNIAIDPAVIGLWEEVPDGDRPPDPDDRMLILKYSDTEYLVHYPTRKDEAYYRAYPIKVDGVSCVQVQQIGTAEGDFKDDRKYDVVAYSLSNGVLEIKVLNTDLVDKDLKDSVALRQAFLKNKDKKNLFTNPGGFRRVKGKS